MTSAEFHINDNEIHEDDHLLDDILEDQTHPDDIVRQAFDFFQFNQRVLNKDVRNMEVDLDRRSARELVSLYYDLQKARLGYNNQVRDLTKAGSPHELLGYYATIIEMLEKSLVAPLDHFGNQFVVGQWAKSQYGIGPVITAVTGGLLRDVLCQVEPVLLHRETIGTSSLMGAIVFVSLNQLDVAQNIAATIGAVVVIATRSRHGCAGSGAFVAFSS